MPDSLCCEGNVTLQYHVQHTALHSVMVIYYTITDFPNPGSIQDVHKFQKKRLYVKGWRPRHLNSFKGSYKYFQSENSHVFQ
jgi:hypothetical protein